MVCVVAMKNKNTNESNGYIMFRLQYRIIKTQQEMRFHRKKQAVSKEGNVEVGKRAR